MNITRALQIVLVERWVKSFEKLRIFFVGAKGSDWWNIGRTPHKPLRTIRAALDKCSNIGGTIRLEDGTYNGLVVIKKKGIRIIGNGEEPGSVKKP